MTTDLASSRQPSDGGSPTLIDARTPDARRPADVLDGPAIGLPCEAQADCPAAQKCCPVCCPDRRICLLPIASGDCPRDGDDSPKPPPGPPR